MSDAPVFGVIYDKSFPDPDAARDMIRQGVEAHPDAVWVIYEKRSTGPFLHDTFAALGVVPVILELDPQWKYHMPAHTVRLAACGRHPEEEREIPARDVDQRREMREAALFDITSRIVVFRDVNAKSSEHWLERKSVQTEIVVVERGKKKRARKPTRQTKARGAYEE